MKLTALGVAKASAPQRGRLEVYACRAVCSGVLGLAEAQR